MCDFVLVYCGNSADSAFGNSALQNDSMLHDADELVPSFHLNRVDSCIFRFMNLSLQTELPITVSEPYHNDVTEMWLYAANNLSTY